MKKLFVATLMFILLATSVMAVQNGNKVGSIDEECRAYFGADAYGIAKFEYENEVFNLADDGMLAGYNINVSGDDSSANWESDKEVASVLSKQGATTFSHYLGGYSGTVNQATQNAISHITFCGERPGEDVPEFGTLAAIGVLALAGLFIYKKRI